MTVAPGHVACIELPDRYCRGCGQLLAPPEEPQRYGVYVYGYGVHTALVENIDTAISAVASARALLPPTVTYVVVQSGGAGVTDWRALTFDDVTQRFVLGESTDDHEEFSPGGMEIAIAVHE